MINQSNVYDFLKLIEAVKDGKKIEFLNDSGSWVVLEEICFTSGHERYRVQKAPSVIWVSPSGVILTEENRVKEKISMQGLVWAGWRMYVESPAPTS